MTPWEAAVARAQAYRLFGEVIDRGIKSNHVEMFMAVEELQNALERYGIHDASAMDPDKLSADHHRIFGLNVPPYAGVFLTDTMHTGGTEYYRAPALRALLLRNLPETGREVESLPTQLLVLSELCTLESSCLENRQSAVVSTIRKDQFLLIHVGIFTYFPIFSTAVSFLKHPLYTPLMHLLWNLMATHARAIGGGTCLKEEVWKDMPHLNAQDPPSLQHENTGLEDILQYLLVPHRSGWYLTRTDLHSIARSMEIPITPTSRKEMLHTLVYGAIDRGEMETLMKHLNLVSKRWLKRMLRLERESNECIAQALMPWRKKLQTLNAFMEEWTITTQRRLGPAMDWGV